MNPQAAFPNSITLDADKWINLLLREVRGDSLPPFPPGEMPRMDFLALLMRAFLYFVLVRTYHNEAQGLEILQRCPFRICESGPSIQQNVEQKKTKMLGFEPRPQP